MSPSSPTKKRKHHKDIAETEIPTKKQRKSFKSNKGMGNASGKEFLVIRTSLVVSVPPVFAQNPKAGVEEMLDSTVMRYIPALQGVVLSHSNICFVDSKATIKGDCPFLICHIEYDTTVWRPRVGMKLSGKINLCSPDHVSLLVHRTFNVSIPRHHIPSHQWEFEYGPAENDPEFGAVLPNGDEDDDQEDEVGRWVRRLTGERLGDTEGYLDFTVIGLTVANEMLSLLGSIQPDPFSPSHVPQILKSNKDGTTLESDIENADEVQEGDEVNENNEVESDSDTFGQLGRPDDDTEREAKKEEVKTDKKRKANKTVEGRGNGHKRKKQ